MSQVSAVGSTTDWVGVGIPAFAMLCFISLAILVLAYGKRTRSTQAFAIFLILQAVWSAGSLMWHLTGNMFWNRVLITGILLSGLSFVYFICEFLGLNKRAPLAVAAVVTLIGLGLNYAGIVVTLSYMDSGVAKMQIGPGFAFITTGMSAIYVWGMVQLVRRYRATRDRAFRLQIQYFILGLGLEIVGGITNGIPGIGHLPIDQACAALTAMLIAYAILRHQLVDIRVVARRGLGYSILTAIVAAAYLLSVFLLQGVFGSVLGSSAYIVAALMAIVFALLFQPFRDVTQSWVDRVFFRERYDAQRMVEELSRATASILNLETLEELVLDKITTAMHISRGLLFVANPDSGVFEALSQRGYPDDVRPSFVSDHPLVSWLRESSGILRGEAIASLSLFKGLLAQERRELSALEIEVFIPMRFKGQLIGILAAGQKLSGAAYLPEDIAALRTVANQVAVAIQNARLVGDLQRSLSELHQTQAQLVQTAKLSAVGQLVAGVAHELNNPLTAITGYSQLLLTEPDMSPEYKGDLLRIGEAAERCARIVRNLLAFARKQGPDKAMCSINRLLEETLSLQDYRLKVENITVIGDLQEDLPDILADRSQLQQVFLNIITNAQHAMLSKEGGTLTISSRLVDNLIRVSITDTGPGIAPEIQSRLFEPFFTTKDVGEGTGLGLSICYGIIQGHGGQIAVQSEPGQGATFIVDIPVRRAEAVAEPATLPGEKYTVGTIQSVLVVDDEEAVARVVKRVLEREGFTVDLAETGFAALDLLAPEAGKHYQLILSDLKMPGLDGPRLYTHLMSERPWLAKRVIFMTGDTSSAETLAFLERTGRRYIAKPFDVDALTALVYQTLSTLPERNK